MQDRVGAVALRTGDVLDGTEFDRGQMVAVIGIGKPFDFRAPTRGEHGDPKVIERGATAEDRFPAGRVCARHRSVAVDKEAQNPALGDPPPRLAVVHGRSPARELHRFSESLGVQRHRFHSRQFLAEFRFTIDVRPQPSWWPGSFVPFGQGRWEAERP